jgi:hypothetical protein
VDNLDPDREDPKPCRMKTELRKIQKKENIWDHENNKCKNNLQQKILTNSCKIIRSRQINVKEENYPPTPRLVINLSHKIFKN